MEEKLNSTNVEVSPGFLVLFSSLTVFLLQMAIVTQDKGYHILEKEELEEIISAL